MRNARWITEKDMPKGMPRNFATTPPNAGGWRSARAEKDRKVLMEIADAWIACAEERRAQGESGDAKANEEAQPARDP